MKKLTMAMIPVLCSAAASLCADAQGTPANDNKPADQQTTMNPITPSAEPKVTRWADPYITADFIWWRAQEDGLEYAFDGVNDSATAHKGSLYHPHFKYEPGFKVGAGLKFRHDGWDLYAQYTWLQVKKGDTKNSVSLDPDGESLLLTNILIPGTLIVGGFNLNTYGVLEAQANWSMHFNVLDLELGRNFWISKWLTMRPFAGMKFSWIDQNFNVLYQQTQRTAPNDYNLHMKLKESSVGLRAGLDTAWYMWKKWCIFADLAISGLWNDFDSMRKDVITPPGSPSFTQNHVDRNSHSLTAVLEWGLGLRFEEAFHKDDYMFMLQAGWEQQMWFDQNQFVMFPNQTPSNLNFEGLTIKAGFYF